MNETSARLFIRNILLCIAAIGFIIVSLRIVYEDGQKHRTYDQEHILLMTQHAYLEGYVAGMLGVDADSTWSELSKRYLFNKTP